MKSGFRNCVIKSIGTSENYHLDREAEVGLRGTAEYVVSSGMLRLFQACPSRWRAGYVPPDSKPMLFGSLVDCLVMTPGEFDDHFRVKPPLYMVQKGERKGEMVWSPTSTVCKEWVAKCESEGITPISEEELAEAKKAIDRMKADSIIGPWIEACDKQVWVTGEYYDEDTELVIPVKILIDFRPRNDSEFYQSLGDLKCIRNAETVAFGRQVSKNGWHFQAAFYEDIYLAAVEQAGQQEDRTGWIFTGVENFHPFEPFRKYLMREFRDIGQRMYQSALRLYCRCLKTGKWPGYDDLPKSHPLACGGFTLIYPEPFMEFAEQSDDMDEEYERSLEAIKKEESDVPMP